MKRLDASNEVKRQIELEEGKAYSAALELMRSRAVFAQAKVDDYLVSVACQEAEGEYRVQEDGSLKWQVPTHGENQHIEIAVQDKWDRRFIPGLEVFCKLLDADGTSISEKQHPFIWHPFLHHYGANWALPAKGKYFAEVSIKRPGFPRHDEFAGNRYTGDVIIRLGPLHLTPGRKSYGPE